MAANDDFLVEAKAAGRAVAGAVRVGGAHREAIHVGAVERRHVDRRGHVVRDDARERGRQRNGLGGERRELDPLREPVARDLGRHHVEELLLACRAADRGDQTGRLLVGFFLRTIAHGQRLTTTSAPAGYPSLSAAIRIHPSACAIACSGQ